MRKRVGDPYETVSFCGSFRKHMNVIRDMHRKFTESGFIVLAPATTGPVVNPEDEFVLFADDVSDDPRELESNYQEQCLRSDVVYVCNPEGYIGGSVMMELGRLVARSEVYFLEKPQEPVICNMASGNIISPEELIRRMKVHNDTFVSREWPDADDIFVSNFLL